jgi:hypothetical protein
MKLKGIAICFGMLKAALCGSYVNFGVFRLYNDEALDNALKIFVKMLLAIPQSDLLVSFISSHCFLYNRTMNEVSNGNFFCVSGLSKSVSDVLRFARVSSTGSHELPCHTRAQCISIHLVVDIRRVDRIRWESQHVHRYHEPLSRQYQ